MSSIDQRVVAMKFDNAQFEQGAKKTLGTLDTLNKGLKLDGAAKALGDVGKAADQLPGHVGGIGTALQTVSSKFSATSALAIGALTAIGFKAVMIGATLAKSLSFDPIKKGLQEYETNLNSIQTILANTQVSGVGLKEVNAALLELNHYSDQTIYNFSEMARNIGTFTAAGVDLKTATASIKGIANLAALSGSNSQQAAGAMYQLSQAIASGKVSLMDWNSVVNAGMGGTTFQRALATTAVAMGKLPDSAVKLSGAMKNVSINGKSFRDSIDATNGPSWLTSDVLTSTLKQFTGDLTTAQIKAMGFKDSEVAAIKQMAQTAKHAATEVKTLTGLIDTAKEVAGSGWSQTWQYIFGDFEEAKTMWTNASNNINKIIEHSAEARNKILADWKKFGGRTAMIESVKNVWSALGSVIKPIKEAFREIFPATTGKRLAEITKMIQTFTAGLKIGGETADRLKRTFAGVFAIFGIGWDILKEIGKTFAHLFGVITGGNGNFLELTARVGDFLVKLRESIQKGEGLKKFFDGLRTVLAAPLKALQKLTGWFVKLFDVAGDVDLSGLDKFGDRIKSVANVGNLAKKAFEGVKKVFSGIKNFLQPVIDKIPEFVAKIPEAISNGLSGLDYDKTLDGLNTGLLAALTGIMAKLLTGGFKLDINGMFGFGGGADGFLGSVKDALDGLKDTMEAYQTQLKANALLKIAGAIALLTASVVALSLIDSAKLTSATVAIGALFAELVGAFAAFAAVSGWSGAAKLPVLATGMILLAVAIDLLAIAVTKLAKLSWEELAKGMLGVVGLLGALIATMKLMPDPKGMIRAGAGILILSVAIKILASAVEDLSGLNWEELGKGLGGVAVLLGALTLFTKFSEANKGGLAQGAGLLLLAVAVKLLASSMKDLGNLSMAEIGKSLLAMMGALQIMSWTLSSIPPTAPLGAAAVLIVAYALKEVANVLDQMGGMGWGEIGKAMTALLGALTIISAALYAIPPTAPLGAAALYITALALKDVADVLDQMGAMDWGAIGKAMTALGGSLLLIAVGVTAMTAALPGAIALTVITAALKALVPVIQQLGDMDWGTIGSALLKLVTIFAAITVAGLLIGPVVPILIGFGVAVALIGAGMLLAGVGTMLFAAGLTALSVAGAAGAAALTVLVTSMLNLLPLVAQKLGEAIIVFAQVIAKAGPAILSAITTVLLALIQAIDRLSPKIVALIVKLASLMLNALRVLIPKMVTTGMDIILAILRGVRDRIGQIVTVAVQIITNFVNGIANNLGKIIQAGVNLIVKFVNGLADGIRNNSKAMGEAGANLATAIIEGMARGLGGGVGKIVSKARDVAKSALDAAKAVLGIHSPSKEFEKIGKYVVDGFRKGLDGNNGQIATAFDNLKNMLSSAMRDSAKDVDTLEAKLKKLTHARHKDAAAIKKVKGELAQAKKEHAAESAAYTELTKKLADEHSALWKLATRYDNVTAKIKDAQKALEDAVKTRDDYSKSIKDQYDKLPEITGETKLSNFVADIRKQIEDTRAFATAIQKLRDLGLNDTMYKELLAKGPAALPFINDVLASGKDGVNELNALGIRLESVAGSLGKTASTELYQAGVDAAAGLVKGLQNQQKAIEIQMDKIADAMVKAIKKKLGIKSPSREFAKVGEYSAQGLAKGLKQTSIFVEKSAANVGYGAVESLRKALSAMRGVWGHVDAHPTIRPVLDLTDLKKDAGLIRNMFPTKAISLRGSYSSARAASAGYQSNRAEHVNETLAAHKEGITFNQYNSSPKALTSAELYRQTRNQLAKAKGALTQ